MNGPVPRLTRSGLATVLLAVAAVTIGRFFGVVELFIVAAALITAVLLGLVAVGWRGLPLTVTRWVHPRIVTVGEIGRVDLSITNPRRRRSARTLLTEPVGPTTAARVSIPPLPRDGGTEITYRIPTERRGVTDVGPLELRRSDLLGLAAVTTFAAPADEILVAPRTHELAMPDLGRGVLGRHLLVQAQRLGTGEFHSLRNYVAGDEPRLIDWRASARTDDVKVREHTTDGVRRCIVVLETADASYRGAGGDEAFERAVEVAASLVHSADRAGLTTRFVSGSDIDLRGPDVTAATLRHLARAAPAAPLGEVERDPGEGLGLVIVVASNDRSSAWRRTDSMLDPSLVRLGVAVGDDEAPPNGHLWIDGSSIDRFIVGWDALTGGPARVSRPITVPV